MLKVIEENVSKRPCIILYSDRLNMPLMHGWKVERPPHHESGLSTNSLKTSDQLDGAMHCL